MSCSSALNCPKRWLTSTPMYVAARDYADSACIALRRQPRHLTVLNSPPACQKSLLLLPGDWDKPNIQQQQPVDSVQQMSHNMVVILSMDRSIYRSRPAQDLKDNHHLDHKDLLANKSGNHCCSVKKSKPFNYNS